MNMEKEQETVEHRTKLEEITDRVAYAYRINKETGVPLDQVAQDRQDLMSVLSAAYAVVDELKTNSYNIRNNNHVLRVDWEARAEAFEAAATRVALRLEEAVTKLVKHED